MLVLLVIIVLFLVSFFLSVLSPMLNSFLFVTIDKILQVLILLFKLFLDFNVDEFWVINANWTCLRLLPHNLIYDIDSLVRKLNQRKCLLLVHIWMNQIYEVLEIWAVSIWRLITFTINLAFVCCESSSCRSRFSWVCVLSLFQNTEIIFWDYPLILWQSCWFLKALSSSLKTQNLRSIKLLE